MGRVEGFFESYYFHTSTTRPNYGDDEPAPADRKAKLWVAKPEIELQLATDDPSRPWVLPAFVDTGASLSTIKVFYNPQALPLPDDDDEQLLWQYITDPPIRIRCKKYLGWRHFRDTSSRPLAQPSPVGVLTCFLPDTLGQPVEFDAPFGLMFIRTDESLEAPLDPRLVVLSLHSLIGAVTQPIDPGPSPILEGGFGTLEISRDNPNGRYKIALY